MKCFLCHSLDRVPGILNLSINLRTTIRMINLDRDSRIDKNVTTKIRKSFTMKLVMVNDNHRMNGKAANHVKRKLKGSGSCKDNIFELISE